MTVQSNVDPELNLEGLLEMLGSCAEVRASDGHLPRELGRSRDCSGGTYSRVGTVVSCASRRSNNTVGRTGFWE